MHHLRRALPLSLLVLALAGAGCWLVKPTTVGVNRVAGNANTVVRLAQEPEGSVLAASASLSGKTFVFEKTYRSGAYRVYTAPAGSEFVVVTFKPLPGNAAALYQSVQESVRLRAGEASFEPKYVDLTSADQTQTNGSFAFEVGKGLTELRLSVGSGRVITLPL